MSSYNYTISNVKLSVKTSNSYTLEELLNLCKEHNLQYKKFHNFVVILCKFKYIIFKKGKKSVNHINITHIKNNYEISDAITFLKSNLDIDVEVSSCIVDNITVSALCPHKVNLPNFFLSNKDLKLSYNNEKFPGLFVKLGNGTIILFSSGKFVIVGIKDESKIADLVKLIRERSLLYIDNE